MAVSTDEITDLAKDTVPEGGPFSDIKEEAGSLFDRMKRTRDKAKAATPKAPRAPKDTTPRASAPKLSAAQAKTAHDRRAKKVAAIVGNVGLGVTIFAFAVPHHTRVAERQEDGTTKLVNKQDDVYMRDAQAIVNGADVIGEQWATLADQNPTVAKYLDALSTSSAWAGALASLLVVIIPIMGNHGAIPAEAAAYFTPEYITSLLDKAKEEVKDA